MSKIKHIEIKNALGIKEIDIALGNINLIQGGNKQGKTSFLEAVEKGLANQDRRENFVRTGETEAFIKIDLDNDISIERTIKAPGNGNDKVKVVRDGYGITAQETFLKSILGKNVKKKNDIFAFNPIDFMQKSDKEQTEIILSLMPVSVSDDDIETWFDGISFDVNTEQHGLKVLKDLEKLFYDKRKEMNAIVKTNEANVKALSEQIPDDYQIDKWENAVLMEYSNKIRAAEKTNSNIELANTFIAEYGNKIKDISNKYELELKTLDDEKQKNIEHAHKSVESIKASIFSDIESFKAQIKELEAKIQQKEANLKAINETELKTKLDNINSNVEKDRKIIESKEIEEKEALKVRFDNANKFLIDNKEHDIKVLESEYMEAETMKAKVEIYKNLVIAKETLKKNSFTADQYNYFLQTAKDKPLELLEGIEMPVKGLSIDSTGRVVINDRPIKNLSTSESIKLCLDIAKATTKNNELKFICIDKFESLDEESRIEFIKQCETDSEYQYFITQVTSGEMTISREL